MGLLSKAVAVSGLNPAEKALRDRILRLAQREEGTSPYTALSLLKAYAAFDIGICLSLKDDAYVSYAAVGLGIERTVIPARLFAAYTARKPYHRVDDPKRFPVKTDANTGMWVFPLDDEAPGQFFFLLTESGSPLFKPAGVAGIVADVRQALLPAAGEGVVTMQPAPIVAVNAVAPDEMPGLFATRESIAHRIREYHREHAVFQGIVLEFPAQDGRNLPQQQLIRVVSSLGTVIHLNQTRDLILLPQEADRELMVHRLVKSLGALCPRAFEANTPERALTILEAFW
ncbi:MAG: hypothetical protein LBS86_04990 [Treponema sp.]|jgi:hypothetical protein|nr:hypothetical protein [Treponema sp.]